VISTNDKKKYIVVVCVEDLIRQSCHLCEMFTRRKNSNMLNGVGGPHVQLFENLKIPKPVVIVACSLRCSIG
jgi:hypothetical protein